MKKVKCKLNQELVDNAKELGLIWTKREGWFMYRGEEVDLSASASDKLSIMINVARQLADGIRSLSLSASLPPTFTVAKWLSV